MLKSILTGFTLPLLLLVGSSSENSAAREKQSSPDTQTATVEKLIVTSGSVSMELDLNRLNDAAAATEPKQETLRFTLAPDSFFTVLVTNGELRGPLPGSIGLIPQNTANLPALLSASLPQLKLEKVQSSEAYELVVRDIKDGFVFFNVERHQYDYDAATRSLTINDGALLISDEFARQLGHPSAAGTVAGKISLSASTSPIEIQTVVNGEARSVVLPSAGTVPGPDVIVGEVYGLAQFDGSSGTQVGLAVGTESCNAGVVDLNWFALSNTDHPVIPQNMYRMSGGSSNNERFEQIGQSSVKHAFTALTNNLCNYGCNGVGGSHLGSGCSDPYSAGLNAGPNLGSRAWINPFTGVFPSTANTHTGHAHLGPSHRILCEIADLNTSLNAGATYYAEGQYVTPHEYAWCQTHPGQCNQYNNVSYRRYTVTGTGSPFTFSQAASTVRQQAAIRAWTGATINQIEPAPGVDGIGLVGYKVTNTGPGVWHYEYALYNQNMDRGILSFSVPRGAGATVTNIGFHAPPQHPGWTADGTVGNAGYSSAPWSQKVNASSVSWDTETFVTNPNANAIRWGTLYNFRFDSNSPPQATNATIGFFKTGSPITVAIQAPSPQATPTPSPTLTPTPPPTATPTPTPTATPTPTPPILVATINLPTAIIASSATTFSEAVMTSAINAGDNLIGFQGDFTFDETVISFQGSPVSPAGLTASNWNVTGNVIPGAGPIRTLRVSAFSLDFTPLSGSGILYNLNMTKISSTPGASTPLIWSAPPDNFYFIDSNLNNSVPGSLPPGSITIQDSVFVSGTISYCSNPALNPVPNVTLTLTGSGSGSTLSDGSGNYMLSSLIPGGTYTVTPTKAALLPASAGISTVDVVAVQRHFLGLGTPLSGCRLTAGDVNGDIAINTVDVIAVQRFFLGLSTGIANTGKYQFTPANRTYPVVGGNQTGQNYDALVFGDVASGFVHRPEGSSQNRAGEEMMGDEVLSTVAAVALPEVAADTAVKTTAIDANSKLVGFQGDFTFDERLVSFEKVPVQKAGLTAGNWNVAGNVLPGNGPIRTLRISAYSNDFTPLSGSGTLFELRMTQVSKAAQGSPLRWAAPPNNFIFIDADLHVQKPGR